MPFSACKYMAVRNLENKKDNSVVSTQFAMITRCLLCAVYYLAMISTQNNVPITVSKTG